MGPLFQWKDGRYLTRDKFVVKVRAALAAASLDPSKYAGYSFRNRAAMTAARCGIQDALIKTLGRWVSTAYVDTFKCLRSSYAVLLARWCSLRVAPEHRLITNALVVKRLL